MVSPSVTSAVYSGAFLGLGSWWACRQALSTVAFSTLCVFMAIFTVGHLGGLYLYLLPFFHDLVPPDGIYTSTGPIVPLPWMVEGLTSLGGGRCCSLDGQVCIFVSPKRTGFGLAKPSSTGTFLTA